MNLPGWASLINQNVHDTPNSLYTYYPWFYYYKLISNANSVILHVDEAEGIEADKQFLKAQGLTFRAYAYMMLAQIYCKRWV